MDNKILYNEDEFPIFVDTMDNGKLKKASLEKVLNKTTEEENKNYTLLLKEGIYEPGTLKRLLINIIGPGNIKKLAKPLTLTYYCGLNIYDDSDINNEEALSKIKQMDFVSDAGIYVVTDDSSGISNRVLFKEKNSDFKTKIYKGRKILVANYGSGNNYIDLDFNYYEDYRNLNFRLGYSEDYLNNREFWDKHSISYNKYIKISDIYVY